MGQPKTVVALAYQVNYSTLYRWCRRYDKTKGFKTLERISGSGRPSILDSTTRQKVMKVVLKPASVFGYETDFWTCRRLIQITKKH
ncbi:MAG: helix-turn-helix domain-containing protein, partial [Nitrospirae bacterium]|nr:helix-turn-helix domain-containing protein [Candidatus Troglogloeales bacterium]